MYFGNTYLAINVQRKYNGVSLMKLVAEKSTILLPPILSYISFSIFILLIVFVLIFIVVVCH